MGPPLSPDMLLDDGHDEPMMSPRPVDPHIWHVFYVIE